MQLKRPRREPPSRTCPSPERARQYEAVVSEPKRFQLYHAPHVLNAEARRDRVAFLCDQLKLKSLDPSLIAGIPDLPQPPEPAP